MTQYKKSKERRASQGRRRYDRKQQGFGGQTKPIFRKKVRNMNTLIVMKCRDANCSLVILLLYLFLNTQ